MSYFQAYVINILIDHPLKKAMNKLEATGRLIKRAVELNKFDGRYQPRKAIKAQALTDFIAEFTPAHDQQNEEKGARSWVVHVDGSSIQYAGGVGVFLQSPKRDCLRYAMSLQFQATNNEVEYKTLLQGLELAKSLGAESIIIQGDSQLIIVQVNRTWEAKKERMKRYLSIKGFTTTMFHQIPREDLSKKKIPREENMEANNPSKTPSADKLVDDQIKVQYISSKDVPEVHQIDVEANWTTLIMSYLKDELLPKDREEARKQRVKAAKFILMDEVLYKRGFPQP